VEKYTQSVCVCFVPFRSPEELQLHSSYVLRLTSFAFPEKHLKILQNIQDAHNSLNSGHPVDVLEHETQKPKEASDDPLYVDGSIASGDEAFDMLVDESMAIGEFPCPRFHVNGHLNFKSNIVTALGSHRCGTRLVKTQSVGLPLTGNLSLPMPLRNANNSNDSLTYCSGSDKPLAQPLHVLMTEETVQTYDPRCKKTVPKAIGTLPNIHAYADVIFGKDLHQKKTFECWLLTFVYVYVKWLKMVNMMKLYHLLYCASQKEEGSMKF
jgi:hypothetical protein